MSMETVPKDLRGLRACLVCSLIKTFDQFEFDGCDNCDEFLRMKNNKDNVFDCTSSNFDGGVNVSLDPKIVEQISKKMENYSKVNFLAIPNLPKIVNPKDTIFSILISRMIAVMSPEDSWVCKWQRINRFCKGVYAISVSGRLPANVIREMKSRGIVYRPRDTSQR